jgi:hypothetical protein
LIVARYSPGDVGGQAGRITLRTAAACSTPVGTGSTGADMTSFEDRGRAFENKFARDEDTAFRITARRNRLLGQWAAGQMKLTPEETDSYAKSVVQADFEEAGDEDVIRKIVGDLMAAGVDTDEAEVRRALDAQAIEARRQLLKSE